MSRLELNWGVNVSELFGCDAMINLGKKWEKQRYHNVGCARPIDEWTFVHKL